MINQGVIVDSLIEKIKWLDYSIVELALARAMDEKTKN